jgi:phosphoribosylanthranilate isomerase
VIELCTFTGIDEKTDFGRLAEISAQHAFVEYGVLFSLSGGDGDPRYPSLEFVGRAAIRIASFGKCALHVCGRAVSAFVRGEGAIRDLASSFDRVQLNFNLDRADFTLEELDAAIGAVDMPVITQHFPANVPVTQSIRSMNHQVLHDTSGGRGMRSDTMPGVVAGKATGYAGGFGPENAAADIALVESAAAGHGVWIDMESKIRTDGWLDLEKCASFASSLASWNARRNA